LDDIVWDIVYGILHTEGPKFQIRLPTTPRTHAAERMTRPEIIRAGNKSPRVVTRDQLLIRACRFD